MAKGNLVYKTIYDPEGWKKYDNYSSDGTSRVLVDEDTGEIVQGLKKDTVDASHEASHAQDKNHNSKTNNSKTNSGKSGGNFLTKLLLAPFKLLWWIFKKILWLAVQVLKLVGIGFILEKFFDD